MQKGTAQGSTRAARKGGGATRARLFDAARRAFAELGYVHTRVDDIVSRAGTSHGTFYTYFRDKKDVLDGLVHESARSLYGIVAAPILGPVETPRQAVRTRLSAFLRAYAGDWDVLRAWAQAEGVHQEVLEIRSRIRQSIIVALTELLVRDRERGLVSENLDLEFTAAALAAMAEGFANDWLTADRTFREEDVERLTELWVRAVYRPETWS